jgi:hypothetical protein
MIFKNSHDRNGALIGLSVYQGFIPSTYAGPTQGPPLPKAPSVSVCVKKGFYRRLDGIATVNCAILTFDDDPSRKGRIDVHNIINRIAYGMMEKNSTVDQSFILIQDTEKEESIEFEVIEDPSVDFHPFYIGFVTAKFGIMSPGPDNAAYNDVGTDTLTWTGPKTTRPPVDPVVNAPPFPPIA